MPTEGSWTYTIVGNAANITDYNGSETNVVIPSTLGGYDVKYIDSYAFSRGLTIVSVIVPDSVIEIKNSAFSGLSSTLESVTLGSSVHTIGNGAFSNCYALKNIDLKSVITIEAQAFSNCTSFTSLSFPSSVNSIGNYAFSGCNNVSRITFTISRPGFGTSSFSLGDNTHPAAATVYSPNNWADGVLDNYSTTQTTFTYREYDPSQYKYLLYDNHKIQVDSAIRDGNGAKIDTHYVVHAEYTQSVSTSQEYVKSFASLSSLGGKIPRLVQVYNSSGEEILTDVKIDLTNECIKIYPITVDPAQTWTVRVTAW